MPDKNAPRTKRNILDFGTKGLYNKNQAIMQKKELEDLLKRVQADFDNYRKRVDKERVETKKSANADLILGLLPVLDNFKRAAQHAPANDNPSRQGDRAVADWATGIKAIEKQFEDIVYQTGLEPIKVTAGDHVDPTKHEVISQEKTNTHPAGTIVRELAKGYMLNGNVLRPAKIVVAS